MKIVLNEERLVSDRYAYYKELRKQGSVLYCENFNAYLLLDYNDVHCVLKDHSRFTSKSELPYDSILLNNDPPEQGEIKKLFLEKGGLFSKQYIAERRVQIDRTACDLFSALEKKENFDLIADFAEPFSFQTILLHLGLEIAELEEMKHWTSNALSFEALSDYESSLTIWENVKPIVERLIKNNNHKQIELVLETLKKCPRILTFQEILDFYKVLILGGSETTPNLIGFCFLHLLEDQNLCLQLSNNPELITSFIDEVLRLNSPTQFVERTTKEEVVIGDEAIPGNSRVLLCIGSANRDENVFFEPNNLNLNRLGKKSLAFGHGSHYCLGVSLAYQEVEIAIQQFLSRRNDIIYINNAGPDFKKSLYINGILNLKCSLFKNYFGIVESTRESAFEFIRNSLLNREIIPSYEHYPKISQCEWKEGRASPFIHANVYLTLKSAGFDLNSDLMTQLRSKLAKFKEKNGIWRFWLLDSSLNNVPPDFDDMSLCSMVFDGQKKFQTSKKLFYLFKKQDGSISTWLYPKFNLLIHFPSIFFSLIRDRKYVRGSIESNFLNYQDSELAVIANMLCYLGSNEKTIAVIHNVFSIVRSHRIEGQFYDDDLVAYYHLSRAYSLGIKEFSELKEIIITRLKDLRSREEFTDLLLKYLVYKNFNSIDNCNIIKISILKELRSNPFAYKNNFKYFTSKDRNYYCGSPYLTTAWFLEVTKEW